MDGPRAGGVIAVVLKGYPRLSETFIAQELKALEDRGLALRLYSMRHPTDPAVHPIHAEIRAPVVYLPEYLHDDWPRVLRAWRRARRFRGYARARALWLRDLMRDPSRNRIRRFGQALVLAAELPSDVDHLYAHFMHTPASVTRYAATITGLPWSVSAHAKDIWTTPDWEKREKLDACAWATTCTDANLRHLRALADDPKRVELVYHGIDRERFPAPQGARAARDGRDPAAPVEILAVGRAVDKKGFDDLLRALALLPADCHWRLVHVGGGPQRPALEALAKELGVAQHVRFLGPQPQARVLDAYRTADVFALPCRVSDDGDRDGLPNVLLEAQSQKLACVSTRISGIPELIDDGVTGLLVEPREVSGLAAALSRLIRDPVLRAQLGEAGLAKVTSAFSVDAGAERLAARFRASLAAVPVGPASR